MCSLLRLNYNNSNETRGCEGKIYSSSATELAAVTLAPRRRNFRKGYVLLRLWGKDETRIHEIWKLDTIHKWFIWCQIYNREVLCMVFSSKSSFTTQETFPHSMMVIGAESVPWYVHLCIALLIFCLHTTYKDICIPVFDVRKVQTLRS